MDSRRLAIPIYLNQRIVFDLLATVEGGFSELQTVRSSESSSSGEQREVAGQIGLSNAFAFLGVGLKGSRGHKNGAETQREVSEERVFTPASLFSRLRDALIDTKLLQVLEGGEWGVQSVHTGTFVEFPAVLRRNPLTEALEGFMRLAEWARVLQTSTTDGTSSKPKSSGKKALATPTSNVDRGVELIKALLDGLNQANTTDLLATVDGGSVRAVVPVALDFFSDKTPATIIDGQFIVLGKVVQVVSESGDAIDLLRGTNLGSISHEMISQLVGAFKALPQHGFRFPEVITQIEGPALQVIPIAIYA